ncbi:hypothetical protein ASG79_17300 [Arthrobacter sp. Soil761]|nr:hypothetical protein ASG79_17300 [Arthrobacter sp. Soil761]
MDLDLSKTLTIFTGTNGTGKTTLLTLIGVHFDWQAQLIGTPVLDEEGHLSFKLGSDILFEVKQPQLHGIGAPSFPPPPYYTQPTSKIGSVEYENGVETNLLVPEGMSPQFSVQYERQQTVDGLYLNSHRSISAYQTVATIPARFSRAEELLASFYNEIRSRFFGTSSQRTSMLIMKESLLAAAIYGEGNSSVVPDEEAKQIWDGFQETLRLLLPMEIGFLRLKASPPEVLLETETGDFTVDALSGGLRAIFELAWQIFLRSHATEQFTVCLDEPENHLHPSLQRSLMPSLMRAFPKVKFIVATHSPFVVNSTTEANVYALTYDESKRVNANLLDLSNSGLSAEDTLRDALGVGSTLPIWAEDRFNAILSAFTSAEPTTETVDALRRALFDAGLASEMPLAVETLVNQVGTERNQ